ncbi:MAG: hypothetical protein HYY49_09900 [Ignavibacteriales bacterium]|nr:hypothetical protein [Ignavibacteriales bacterium]
MNKTTKIVFSSLLILVFSFFSVGVPVVQYLCPMMSSENLTCDMSPTANATGTTVSSLTPDCCAKQLGAERNTTPFLKVDKLQTDSPDALAVTFTLVDDVSSESFLNSTIPFFHKSTTPLFLIHSALLI